MNYDYSLDLSINGKIESKIKMECIFLKEMNYCLNVYTFRMQRDSIKKETKIEKNRDELEIKGGV